MQRADAGNGRNKKNDAQADKERIRTHTTEGPLRGRFAKYVLCRRMRFGNTEAH